MKKIFEIGKRTFEVDINWRKNYELTKFRNKIQSGIDFDKADKQTLTELEAMYNKKIKIEELSPKTLQFLRLQSEQVLLSDDDIIEIMMLLTGITNQEEIDEILNIEMEENGFEAITNKLVDFINNVFTSAKDGSTQKEINK